jgi:hypothetical protein
MHSSWVSCISAFSTGGPCCIKFHLLIHTVPSYQTLLFDYENTSHQYVFLLLMFVDEEIQLQMDSSPIKKKKKQTPWPLVRERTIPTERPVHPLVMKLWINCGLAKSRADAYCMYNYVRFMWYLSCWEVFDRSSISEKCMLICLHFRCLYEEGMGVKLLFPIQNTIIIFNTKAEPSQAAFCSCWW